MLGRYTVKGFFSQLNILLCFLSLKVEFKGIPRVSGSYHLGECHRLYGLGRHKEPP